MLAVALYVAIVPASSATMIALAPNVRDDPSSARNRPATVSAMTAVRTRPSRLPIESIANAATSMPMPPAAVSNPSSAAPPPINSRVTVAMSGT